jgi:hypothetical protein
MCDYGNCRRIQMQRSCNPMLDCPSEYIRYNPCLANSLLADDGFPCACETDIHGAVSAVMIQAACMDEKPHSSGCHSKTSG